MKLTTKLKISFDIEICGKPVFYKKVEVGKITNARIKDGKLWVDIIINSKKKKIIQKLMKILGEL